MQGPMMQQWTMCVHGIVKFQVRHPFTTPSAWHGIFWNAEDAFVQALGVPDFAVRSIGAVGQA